MFRDYGPNNRTRCGSWISHFNFDFIRLAYFNILNTENGLRMLKKDPTAKFQRNVKDVVKKCNVIFNKSNKYKLIQIKPQAPKPNAFIKLHKDNLPIRPVVNYKNAPTYHIAKLLAKWLKQNMTLPFKYNIDSTIHCAEALKKINVQPT
jgi:hypothetical protein